MRKRRSGSVIPLWATAFLFYFSICLCNPVRADFQQIMDGLTGIEHRIGEATQAGHANELVDVINGLGELRDMLQSEQRDPSISEEELEQLHHRINGLIVSALRALRAVPGGGEVELPRWVIDDFFSMTTILPPPLPPEEGEEPYMPELPTQPQEPPPPEPDSSPTTEAVLKAPQKKEGVTASVEVKEKEKVEARKEIGVQEVQATVTVKEERKEHYPPLSLFEGLKGGALVLAINGTGTTTRMACTLTNKTSEGCTVVIPTGTPLVTGSKDHQPYQTGYIPPIELGPGETETVEVPAFCTDSEKAPAPKDGSVAYALHEGPLTPKQEKITEIIVVTNTLKQLHETCGKVAEPDDFLAPPKEDFNIPLIYSLSSPIPGPETREDLWFEEYRRFLEWVSTPEGAKFWVYSLYDPKFLDFNLSGELELPGFVQFILGEVPELKTGISSRKEKGEVVFSNPKGKVEVSLTPTKDPNVVKFNITKLEAGAPSFKALGKSRKDINIALNSPEKSTGTLNIKTGEVKGTVSVKAWGKKYKEPFPAAASYTGKFDIPTKKLGLNLKGMSFEPVDLEEGLYQRVRPEKFWDSVMLYSIWKETNDQGKEELAKVMTEQLRADFPEGRAEELAAAVAGEIVHRVDEVHERHKKLEKEEVDFSTLDPTLKWRKT